MIVGVYPGSFDPVTYGHLDIIARSSHMVDKLIVAVLKNSSKSPLFSVEERVELLKTVTAKYPNVEVDSFSGLLVDYVQQQGAQMIIRGLRAVTDFEYELQMAQMNRTIAKSVDTMFLTTSLEYAYLSSSIVKEVAMYGGDLRKFIPPEVETEIQKNINEILKQPMGRMEQNMSRIEQLITEIEEYIDSCKPQPFSTTKIIVDKGTLEELLVELRHRTPDEIKKYQKILSNKEAIIADAKAQAESMIASATEQTQELINEHEIMQQAYKKANEIIERATAQAQMIVDQAAADANELRESGVDYVEDMLKNMEALVSHTVENTSARYNSFLTSLNSTAEIIRSNLEELHPTASQAIEETAAPEDAEAATAEK